MGMRSLCRPGAPLFRFPDPNLPGPPAGARQSRISAPGNIFADFAKLFPGRFINITNGITPRRWLANANRPLSALIDKSIGTDWRKDLGELSKLKKFADKPEIGRAHV